MRNGNLIVHKSQDIEPKFVQKKIKHCQQNSFWETLKMIIIILNVSNYHDKIISAKKLKNPELRIFFSNILIVNVSFFYFLVTSGTQ